MYCKGKIYMLQRRKLYVAKTNVYVAKSNMLQSRQNYTKNITSLIKGITLPLYYVYEKKQPPENRGL